LDEDGDKTVDVFSQSSDIPNKEASMKSVLFITVCALVAFLGCATTPPAENTVPQMELISMTSLPALPARFPMGGLKLNVLFHVLDDGSVPDVKLLSTSGDENWDRVAIDSMKQWHFTASTQFASPSGRWIRNMIVVQVQEPTVITLGQLTALSRQEADSVYALLEQGTDFDTLLKRARPGSQQAMGVYFGTINIARFPQQVRAELQKLGVNNYTVPIRVGTSYFIYKRYAGDGSRFLPQ
jgi:TonB family protein